MGACLGLLQKPQKGPRFPHFLPFSLRLSFVIFSHEGCLCHATSPRDNRPGLEARTRCQGWERGLPRLLKADARKVILAPPNSSGTNGECSSSSQENRSLGFFSPGAAAFSSFLPPCPSEAWAHGPERHPGIQKHEGEVPIGGEGKSLGWGLPLEGPSVFPGLVDWAFTGDLEPDPRPPGGPQTPSETGGPRGRLRGPQVITSPGSHKPGSCL